MTPKPPFTPVREVVESVHGVEIRDSYQWLEETGSEEVRRWVERQRAYTRAVLDAYPRRSALELRLQETLGCGVLGPSEPRAGRRFFARRTGSMAGFAGLLSRNVQLYLCPSNGLPEIDIQPILKIVAALRLRSRVPLLPPTKKLAKNIPESESFTLARLPAGPGSLLLA